MGSRKEIWWAWVDLNHRPRPYQLSTGRLRRALTDCNRLQFASVYAALAHVGECDTVRPLAANVECGVHQNVHQLPSATL
jgi:hypothetical protein